MEYFDGWTKHWYNSVTVVGAALDGTLAAISGGWSLMSTYALKNFIRANRNKVISTVQRTLLRHVGAAAASNAATILNIALAFSGSGLGTWLAKAVDYLEGNWGYTSGDGYLFN